MLSLSFPDPAQERAFRKDRKPRLVRNLKVGGLVLPASLVAAAWLGRLSLPNLMSGPITGLAAFLFLSSNYVYLNGGRAQERLAAVAYGLSLAAIGWMSVVADPAEAPFYLAGLMLGMVSWPLLIGMRLDTTLKGIAIPVAFFLVWFVAVDHGPLRMLSAYFVELGIGAGFSLGNVYVLEKLERRKWLQSREIARQREQLELYAAQTTELLHSIVPSTIADRILLGETLIADSYDDVTVLFADIVNFTQLSNVLTSAQVVDLLNLVFSEFDDIVGRYGLEKIKTIGDCYMVAAGVPLPREDHVQAIAHVSLEMLAAIGGLGERAGAPLQLRIGLHSGQVTAGVIGHRKFLFDLWGDTVNTASRMESHGVPGTIQVTESVQQRLNGSFVFEGPRQIDVKGMGLLQTWYLRGAATAE